MNTYRAIDVFYLRPSRTIETILVSKGNIEKIFFVYNYEGWFFRVFENVLDLMNFFDDLFEPEVYFEVETELDNYLESTEI